MKNIKTLTISSVAFSVAIASGCTSMTATQPGVLTNLIAEANNTTAGIDSNQASSQPAYLTSLIKENQQTGARDQVVVNMKAGVLALNNGDYHITKRVMEDAYNRIETVYANNEAAKATRSNYVQEANKDFKGEPYERAMVGYYLGLSDMLSGDLQSAKSSFSWGEYQDTLSASEEYRGDMDSLVYLRAWAKHCEGEKSSAIEDFDSINVRPVKKDNVLVLIEAGKAPVKYSSGEHNEKLKFKASPYSTYPDISIYHGGKRLTPFKLEDVAFQATTRGGRQFDAVLAGKAEFKDSTATASDVSAGVGVTALQYANVSAQFGDIDSMQTSLGLSAIAGLGSLLFDAVSDATIAQADTRQWDNLPHYIFAQTIEIQDADSDKDIKVFVDNKLVNITPQKTGKCYLAHHKIDA